LAGKISEEQLKDGLVRALHEPLQQVRDHFTNDDTARELLEQVREFKRETTTSAVLSGETPKVFRLDLVKACVVPKACHLVGTFTRGQSDTSVRRGCP
jgi:hypothetical protein